MTLTLTVEIGDHAVTLKKELKPEPVAAFVQFVAWCVKGGKR